MNNLNEAAVLHFHCKNCGNLITRKSNERGRYPHYCNYWCGVIARGGKLPPNPITECLFCNQVIDQRKTQGNPKKYCSKSCGGKYLQAKKPKKPFVSKACQHCAKEFWAQRDQDKFCSVDCRKDATAIRAIEKWRVNNPLPKNYNYKCDDCDRFVERSVKEGRLSGIKLCQFCGLKRRRESYRRKTVKRQGITQPGKVYFEVVVERDKSICWICNELVDLSLSRTTALGATLDHVIPISKGGPDTLENIRLAHWIWNNRKSDKLIEGLNA
jgi:hypothetical protein